MDDLVRTGANELEGVCNQPISQAESWPEPERTRDVVVLFRQSEMAGIEQVDFAIRQSRLNAPAGAMNEGSFDPQTTKVGGLCSRSHVCHAG
jgi:hypothetical protein